MPYRISYYLPVFYVGGKNLVMEWNYVTFQDGLCPQAGHGHGTTLLEDERYLAEQTRAEQFIL